MGHLGISGVLVTRLKTIHHPKGPVLHCMRCSDAGFTGFAEAYFSSVIQDEVKAWKRHRRMTLNLVVPAGEIKFVIYDDRPGSASRGEFGQIRLSPDNYQRLTLPPMLWFGFQGLGEGLNLLLNIADVEHDPDEVDGLPIGGVDYEWCQR